MSRCLNNMKEDIGQDGEGGVWGMMDTGAKVYGEGEGRMDYIF